MDKVREQLSEAGAIVPHTARERRLWKYVAITAGCCEELIFRGFVFAFLASYLGVAGGLLVSAVAFGLYHAYYGPAGIAKTGVLGLAFGGLTVASGSLLPAAVVHVAIDLVSGNLAYRALATPGAGPPPPSQER